MKENTAENTEKENAMQSAMQSQNALKENDFAELDYTGRIAETGEIFDTTVESVVQEHDLGHKHVKPIAVCIGHFGVIAGLSKQLIGKEVGRSYTIRLNPDNAFGRKSASLLKMIPSSAFKKEGITPAPGMQINMDGIVGTVLTAAGGRYILDFNHPLAGKDIEYEVTVKRMITDNNEKISAMIEELLGIKPAKTNVEGANATIEINGADKIPENIKQKLSEMAKKLCGIDKMDFIQPAQPPAQPAHSTAAETKKESKAGKADKDKTEAKKAAKAGKTKTDTTDTNEAEVKINKLTKQKKDSRNE